jgi:hypothetical protein
VHTARTEGRVYPVEPLQELRTFFAYLHQVGYTARVSIEGRSDDMRRDGAAALAVLRGLDKP